MKNSLSLFAFITSVSVIFSCFGIFLSLPNESSEVFAPQKPTQVIVIDAGHGGEDGGASSYGDVTEKELNLAIAQNLRDMLTFCGLNVIMTRDEDFLLYDKNSDYKGHKKSQDLAKRLEIARSVENAILISIHMNAFPEEKYSGLQVYFSKNHEKSFDLANSIQTSTTSKLSPENNRRVKPADKNIYLLDRFENVGILIECGFLSNREEYGRLCSDEYKKELAAVFLECIVDFTANDQR